MFCRWLAAFFSVKGQTSRKFPHRVAVLNRVFSSRIGEIKPDLKQIHPQHFLDAHRRTAAFSLGIIRLDYTDPFIPRNNSSMISRNSSRLIFFLRQLYSISVNVSCFILFHHPYLTALLYHIPSLHS